MSKTQFALQATGFDALYGLEILSLGEAEATARVSVRDAVKQPAGLVHGGLYASIAESVIAKVAGQEGTVAQGLSSQTSFLRPIMQGAIQATARRRHRGRSTWVWEVDITDDEGRLCALVRMTMVVRQP